MTPRIAVQIDRNLHLDHLAMMRTQVEDAEARLLEAVRNARRAGLTWKQIGPAIGRDQSTAFRVYRRQGVE